MQTARITANIAEIQHRETYVVFVIEVCSAQARSPWRVPRRYSEFEQLQKRIEAAHGVKIPLPRKRRIAGEHCLPIILHMFSSNHHQGTFGLSDKDLEGRAKANVHPPYQVHINSGRVPLLQSLKCLFTQVSSCPLDDVARSCSAWLAPSGSFHLP